MRFGRSVVDVPARWVEHDGEARHLEPQAFDLLAYLIEHRNRVIPKEELLDEVWGDQFVSESALTTRIKEVRRAVGDDGTRQVIIKNFRGRGYRFVADVEDAATVDSGRARRPVVTSLFGRDDDIAVVDRLLDDARLVSLVGPGGVGKTSLARDIAALRRDVHTEGVVTVRLASVRDPDAILHVLRREAGLEEAGDTEADLIAAIADLDALFVLDNCEHVLGEVARLVVAISSAGGRVRMLATSRERLGIGVEQVWPVEPLDLDVARRLLDARARAARPAFRFPADSDARVIELLERVDRLPLAVEMAAARLPSVGLDDLLALLRERADLLPTADRSADDRHATIGALIDWSEQLLEDDQREVLTCLSVFAGPATAADVAAVTRRNVDELTIGALAACVDHSLVVADTVRQPTAYRLLETVRAHASRRATAAHVAAHAQYVIDVAVESDRRLRTPDEPLAARRLSDLEADLRVAHRWAREHDPRRAGELTAALIHFANERQWIEPVAWARQLRDVLADDDPGAAPALAACAASHAIDGELSEAASLAELALRSSDPRVTSSALNTLINVAIYGNDLTLVRRYLELLHELGEASGDTTISANAVTVDMLARAYDGHPSDALAYLETADVPMDTSPTARAWLAYAEGDSLAASGRDREAVERFDDAIRLGSAVGSRFVVRIAQLSSLVASTRTGDVGQARAAFIPLLGEYWRARNVDHAVTALVNFVELLVQAQDDEKAMTLLGALSSPGAKRACGAESQRLDDARATVESRVGRDLVQRWIDSGTGHDVLWAVDHAIGALS